MVASRILFSIIGHAAGILHWDAPSAEHGNGLAIRQAEKYPGIPRQCVPACNGYMGNIETITVECDTGNGRQGDADPRCHAVACIDSFYRSFLTCVDCLRCVPSSTALASNYTTLTQNIYALCVLNANTNSPLMEPLFNPQTVCPDSISAPISSAPTEGPGSTTGPAIMASTPSTAPTPERPSTSTTRSTLFTNTATPTPITPSSATTSGGGAVASPSANNSFRPDVSPSRNVSPSPSATPLPSGSTSATSTASWVLLAALGLAAVGAI